MRQSFFILVLISIIAFKSSAQKRDTVFYYMTNYGKVVNTADSADFVRVIIAPDKEDKAGLFTVADVFRNGNKRMSAQSHSSSYIVKLEGSCIRYYPSGGRESIINYENGSVSGQAIKYYPNGQLYTVTQTKDKQTTLIECHDTTGRVLAENGEGTWLDVIADHTTIYQRGTIVKGMRQGKWVKLIDGKELPFEYHNGKAVIITNSEHTSEIISKPDLPAAVQDGGDTFLAYIAKNTRYPGIAREKSITGVVWVSFVVEKNGVLNDIKVDPGASQSLDEEAMRVVKECPLTWIPAFDNGKPVRTVGKVPVCFMLMGLPEFPVPAGSVIVAAGGISRLRVR